jgi:hypothetical protein
LVRAFHAKFPGWLKLPGVRKPREEEPKRKKEEELSGE